ncbi:restriction endonuclease [Agromyces sp. NPDC056523]|uniref:nSTAND1 domain-containing NTPase n=1 Tax=Agromyces sp. NPDC056523 TaxID=3345850 RepID=UPI00366AA186
MESLLKDDVALIVLSEAVDAGASRHARGHLFERFCARLLESFGYEDVKSEDANVTSEGIEIDFVARHKLTRKPALVECKAYSSAVAAKEMLAFVGKLSAERHAQKDLEGYFICLPRLTSQGVEKAKSIEEHDQSFHYLSATAVYELLVDAKILGAEPAEVGSAIVSDRLVAITEHGVYSAAKRLDPVSRVPTEVLIWGPGVDVPDPAVELIRTSDYAGGLSCRALSKSGASVAVGRGEVAEDILIEVRGGSSDFEYQLPASPKYFVGRRDVLHSLATALDEGSRVMVINAQSGWGKSSLALRLRRVIEADAGVGLVFDSRTVSRTSYVASALRKAAEAASKAGVLTVTEDASWASLASAMRTLAASRWAAPSRRLLVIFDQFENVFRDENLTRDFRDLALLASDAAFPIVIGFAWKTDVVGWTEGYPYQLRDEIRQSARIVNLSPLGPSEIGTLLSRLEKELGSKLRSDLKVKLREYSQGLPWLMKKLASHVLDETRRGISQDDLVSEALNVQRLFENDLQALQPGEREALNWVAKFAPVLLSEALERFPAGIVQSLLDRRLIVQVGERLDTYWDIFRDYLTTGRVPIEDAYTLRVSVNSVGRLLQTLLDVGGSADVGVLADLLGWAEPALFNAVRDARVLGLVRSGSRRVEVLVGNGEDEDPEDAIRARVSVALKRHRVYSAYQSLNERLEGNVTISELASRLPVLFPAITAAPNTWNIYATVFAKWFDYAGLVSLEGTTLKPVALAPSVLILDPSGTSRGSKVFPQRAPDPALRFLERLSGASDQMLPASETPSSNVVDLIALGLVERDRSGYYRLLRPEIVDDGHYSPAELLSTIKAVPGGTESLALLEADPRESGSKIGEVLRAAQNTSWSEGTVEVAGKQFRAWANRAGVFTGKGARRTRRQSAVSSGETS